ncbi:MAG: hypothetical protein K2X77_21095 [Candidatus Obscuribacterales bacterium]|jgi:hypothetical protein|nr:hypothetical protein [Candidatus Obscuribacterales bacterium]
MPEFSESASFKAEGSALSAPVSFADVVDDSARLNLRLSEQASRGTADAYLTNLQIDGGDLAFGLSDSKPRTFTTKNGSTQTDFYFNNKVIFSDVSTKDGLRVRTSFTADGRFEGQQVDSGKSSMADFTDGLNSFKVVKTEKGTDVLQKDDLTGKYTKVEDEYDRSRVLKLQKEMFSTPKVVLGT